MKGFQLILEGLEEEGAWWNGVREGLGMFLVCRGVQQLREGMFNRRGLLVEGWRD